MFYLSMYAGFVLLLHILLPDLFSLDCASDKLSERHEEEDEEDEESEHIQNIYMYETNQTQDKVDIVSKFVHKEVYPHRIKRAHNASKARAHTYTLVLIYHCFIVFFSRWRSFVGVSVCFSLLFLVNFRCIVAGISCCCFFKGNIKNTIVYTNK